MTTNLSKEGIKIMENVIIISVAELKELINNDLAVFEAQLYKLLKA